MFFECNSLISVDLSNFVIDNICFDYLFYGCISLEYVNFTDAYILPYTMTHTFENCKSIISIDLSTFDFSYCEDMQYIFYNCHSLITIEFLDMLYAPYVENMQYMFYGCNSLKDIDLSLWFINSVKNLEYLFYNCYSLSYLDLSNFDTKLTTNMKYIFSNCIKITSINLDNFITSSANDMESMFYECNSLVSLDLSSFDTSLVTNMKSMFFGCFKLTSLNLSNFIFENITNMGFMFGGCSNLSYINIYNYDDVFKPDINEIFWDTSENLIVVINKETNIDLIKKQLISYQCINYNESYRFEQNNKKVIYDTKVCINDCLDDEFNKYEYENFCFKECPMGTHLLLNDSNICEANKVDCLENYPYLNLLDNSCIDICYPEDFFKNKCSLNSHTNENQKNHILNIINGIENGEMNYLLLEVINQNKDLIIFEKDIVYQITTSFNQNKNNKEYQNISDIYLGEIEKEIKDNYKISKNDALIINILLCLL